MIFSDEMADRGSNSLARVPLLMDQALGIWVLGRLDIVRTAGLRGLDTDRIGPGTPGSIVVVVAVVAVGRRWGHSHDMLRCWRKLDCRATVAEGRNSQTAAHKRQVGGPVRRPWFAVEARYMPSTPDSRPGSDRKSSWT